MNPKKSKLGEILIGEKLISGEELEQALEEQKRTSQRLGEILISKRFISPQDLNKALEIQLGVPYISLTDYRIDPEIAHIFPEHIVRRCKAIPIKEYNGHLEVALVNPYDLSVIDELKLISGYKIKPLVTTEKELNDIINRYFDVKKTAFEAIKEVNLEGPSSGEEITELSTAQLQRLGKDAPATRMVNSIIMGALSDEASDIHIEPREKEVRIRYRIDGILYDIMSLPKRIQMAAVSRLKILSRMDIAEQRRPQDGRFSANVEGKEIDFRLATLPTVHGEKMEIRILNKENMLLGLGELGLSPEEEKVLNSLIHRPYGMILNTSPTGCGKTTTLYAILSQINKPELNIITIEDPVEYELEGINQVHINPKAGVTFAKGLRSILRQDPNIIMVGEIRDRETAEIAVQAALTGHLVFSTLHTNDAPSAVVRLIDMGIERFLIVSSLIGVVAQRLVRTICPNCREEYQPSEEMRKEWGLSPDVKLYRGRGCSYCHNTGYRGRTGIFEIMRVNDFIKELLVSRGSATALREASIDAGMRPLRKSGLAKVVQGLTTLEEVKRVTEAEG